MTENLPRYDYIGTHQEFWYSGGNSPDDKYNLYGLTKMLLIKVKFGMYWGDCQKKFLVISIIKFEIKDDS